MTEAPPARSVSTLAAEPTQRVGGRWIALIALANLGLYLGYIGPISVLLPNQVQAIAGSAHKVAVLGWVTGIGAAVAMVANPVAAALAFLAGQHAIAGVIAGWCLVQAGLNAMQASLTACVPDHVPVAQRGVVSAWIGLPQTLGVLLAVVLVTDVVSG